MDAHDAATASSQRKDLRVAWRLPVELRPLPGGDVVAATSQNVSTGGMGLLCPAPLPARSTVEVVFELPEGVHRRGMVLRATVLRCVPAAEGGWGVALRFAEVDSRDRAYLRSCVLQQALRSVQSLAEFQAFRDVAELDLLELASVLHELVLQAGDAVARYGDEASCVFLIRRGKVELRTPLVAGGGVEVAHAGQMFGEVATLLGLPHDHDAVAVEDTQLLVIPRAALSYLRDHNPHLALVLHEVFVAFLGRRVRRLSSRLAAPVQG